ncbi:hypothetical protein B9Z55_008877 [Caenorhabditis nigoni]|uniref:Uncharacterized protein n=1 Tax=Caenorhabditis nigoni TaxID=1611254 RepID=A0A2G5UQE0_9PELO|nr:hypothetical protein B9Z55_008877 [Caenorhabditis nigoni]
MLCNRLRSYGADSNLIAGASSDQTIRIHHIGNQGALITIGGPFCHPGPVSSRNSLRLLEVRTCSTIVVSSK